MIRNAASAVFILTAVFGSLGAIHGQDASRDGQERVRVFTEEVRLPLLVIDESGRFDPTLEIDDIVIFEDGVMQEVRSVRRVPANVLLLLDTAGWNNPAMKTSVTREVALNVLRNLEPRDRVAVVQMSNRVELIQDWTEDRELAIEALSSKLSSGRRARVGEGLRYAATLLSKQPAGSRHVVLITDGVETSSDNKTFSTNYSDSLRQLANANATIHILSYTTLGREAIENPHVLYKGAEPHNVPRTAGEKARDADPNSPGAQMEKQSASFGTIYFDPAIRRVKKEYIKATKRSEEQLTALATGSGGRIWLPESLDEILEQARLVGREIGSHYVVTYRPKRPLVLAKAGEYRRISVTLRRPGLTVRSRPGYAVTPAVYTPVSTGAN